MDLNFREKRNKIITLTKERIKHIKNHMQLNDKIHIIESTLKYPDILSKDNERENIYYYQKYLKNERLYFIIVIKMFNGKGIIITIYKGKNPKE